jgi:hypothetical protein
MQAEILKSEATPAMRLLNELLHLHDGGDDDKWLKKCRKHMLEVFPREDPFTMVFPAGFNMEKVSSVQMMSQFLHRFVVYQNFSRSEHENFMHPYYQFN